jgi:DNA-binding transcriptional ArsR family regulator
MTYKVMTWAVEQRTGSPTRKAVLMNLADRADGAWLCWPGQKLIAKDTELGERTVRRALDDLEQAGLIRRYRHRRKDGSWSSDRYVLAGIDNDPDGLKLLADSEVCGQSGHRPERPAATTAEPAATVAGHEPPVTNPHSLSPTERGGAHADAHTREADNPPQLTLVDEPEKPAKAKRLAPHVLPDDWTLSPELVAAALAQVPGLDIEREFARFRRHVHGTRKKWVRWDLAWGNWLDRVEPPARGSRPGSSSREPYRDSIWEDGTADASWDAFMAVGQEPGGAVGEITTRNSVVQPFRDDVVDEGWQ